MMNDPDRYQKRAYDDAEMYAFMAKRENKILKLRWNDAGDVFSNAYFEIIKNVTNQLLKNGYNVESYAYTKVGKYVKLGDESGIVMNFSSGAKSSERNKVDIHNIKYSKIIKRDVYKDFFTLTGFGWEKDETGRTKFKDHVNGRKDLKKRIYEHLKNDEVSDVKGVSYESLKYTDELPLQQGKKFEYNVIVLPAGDSDVSAQRRDVKYTFLLEH